MRAGVAIKCNDVSIGAVFPQWLGVSVDLYYYVSVDLYYTDSQRESVANTVVTHVCSGIRPPMINQHSQVLWRGRCLCQDNILSQCAASASSGLNFKCRLDAQSQHMLELVTCGH